MNKELLKQTKTDILNSIFPIKSELFAGANLIITSDPNRTFHEGDIVVVSKFATKISWLVFRLKEIFKDEIDYLNKYDFYPFLGKIANNEIMKGHDLQTILTKMIEGAEEWESKYRA